MSFISFLKYRVLEGLLVFVMAAIIGVMLTPVVGRDWGEQLFLMPTLVVTLIYVISLYIVTSAIWTMGLSGFLFGDNRALRNATAPLFHILLIVVLVLLFGEGEKPLPEFWTIGSGVCLIIVCTANYFIAR